MAQFRPSRLQVIGFAVAILAIQRIGLVVLETGRTGTLFLDSLIVFANCLAIGCCIAAARRGQGVSRIFWLLFGIAFGLQLVADVSWAYLNYFQIAIAENALFPSLFYRLYVGPMSIALFLSEDVRTSKLESFFDASIVVGLVALCMYQLQLTELNAHDPRLWRVITMGTAVNVALLVGATARFAVSGRGILHGLFGRQAIFLVVYSCVSLVTSIGDAFFPDIDAYIDPIWIISYLVGAALAATWHPPAAGEQPGKAKIGRRTSLLSFNLTLAAMVLGCTVLGLRVSTSTRTAGMLAIGVVLLSYAIRSALMQDNQEKYLAALQVSRAQLQHQALYDELTGLPNRRLFAERLSQTLAVAQREGNIVALLYFDLDGFKPVNDSLGHAIGDLLMSQVAARLAPRTRKSDTLARMGGDEFTVLLAHLSSKDHAGAVAWEMLRTLAEPFLIEGHSIAITASMGIGIFPGGAADAAGLIHQADTAMYAVKRSGGNGVRYFSPELE